jgi:hypothetical protein
MADTLSRKLTAERIASNIPGLKPSPEADAVNHSLFAEDSMLLGGASSRIATAFDSVLKSYCRVSGALINDRKSEIYCWNTGQQELNNIVKILGFNGHANWERIKYLGLPITIGANRRSLWVDIISKLKSKIAAWGGFWLTNAGKLILIKSQLAALPIYQSAFLLAPRAVTDQIKMLIRDFLWHGGKGNENRLHLAKWELVRRPIADGGLQIRDPALINLSLGGKLLWQIAHDPNHPTSKTLLCKYARDSSYRNLQYNSTGKSTLVWNLCCKSSKFFNNHLYRASGNGKNTNLWHDRIMGRDPLKENQDTAELRDWLIRAGKTRLFDISKWDRWGD